MTGHLMDMVFIRRCVKILEHSELILEEWLHLFENSGDILEDSVFILEVAVSIKNGHGIKRDL